MYYLLKSSDANNLKLDLVKTIDGGGFDSVMEEAKEDMKSTAYSFLIFIVWALFALGEGFTIYLFYKNDVS